jgi:hypothetical protein
MAAMLLGGCATEEFVLEADLPGNFALVSDARYSLPAGSRCGDPAQTSVTQRIFQTAEHGARPRRISFPVPLSIRAGGCTRELSQVNFELDAKPSSPAAANLAPAPALASLSILGRLAEGAPKMPERGARIFDGLCYWKSGLDSQRLECHASDIDGSRFDGNPGGQLQRDELPGRIVRLAIGMAPEIPATATER